MQNEDSLTSCSNKINYCENTRSSDQIFKNFSAINKNFIKTFNSDDINHILDYLKNNLNSFINHDKECLSQLGQRSSKLSLHDKINGKCLHCDTLNNLYMCSSCINILRLVNPENVKDPFIIQYGKMSGKKCIISEFHQNINPICEFDNYGLKIDKFTNNIISHWYLDHYLRNNNINHIKDVYSSFICGNSGYILQEYTSNLIPSNNELSIIKQLFTILHHLKKINFSHGYPTISSLSFNSSDIKLSNFWDSSFTLPSGIRIYSNTNFHHQLYPLQNTTTFKLPCSKKNYSYIHKFMLQNKLGLNNNVSAFDGYCFLISLLSNKQFYNNFMSNDHLSKLWISLWSPQELSTISQRLQSIENPLYDIHSVLNILCNLTLRSDLIDHIFKNIQNF